MKRVKAEVIRLEQQGMITVDFEYGTTKLNRVSSRSSKLKNSLMRPQIASILVWSLTLTMGDGRVGYNISSLTPPSLPRSY